MPDKSRPTLNIYKYLMDKYGYKREDFRINGYYPENDNYEVYYRTFNPLKERYELIKGSIVEEGT